MLYVVSTPIGNLGDITYRAVEVLKNVDVIAVEDTRRTGILLKHYEISAKMLSYNDINKKGRTKQIIGLLKEGQEVAIVSDAGTPGISDPGFYLVRECVKEDIEVVPIPGASAILSALVCSGLPTDRFTFAGFIDKKSGRKKSFIESLRDKDETVIFYESPHRIIKTIKLMSEVIPDKQVVIARELTKKFEEFISGSAIEVYEKVKDRNIKGEIVVLVSKTAELKPRGGS